MKTLTIQSDNLETAINDALKTLVKEYNRQTTWRLQLRSIEVTTMSLERNIYIFDCYPMHA